MIAALCTVMVESYEMMEGINGVLASLEPKKSTLKKTKKNNLLQNIVTGSDRSVISREESGYMPEDCPR